jgi:hypothetical protein
MRSEREREGHREKEIRRKKERQGIEDEGQERDREEETDMGKGRTLVKRTFGLKVITAENSVITLNKV